MFWDTVEGVELVIVSCGLAGPIVDSSIVLSNSFREGKELPIVKLDGLLLVLG